MQKSCCTKSLLETRKLQCTLVTFLLFCLALSNKQQDNGLNMANIRVTLQSWVGVHFADFAFPLDNVEVVLGRRLNSSGIRELRYSLTGLVEEVYHILMGRTVVRLKLCR